MSQISEFCIEIRCPLSETGKTERVYMRVLTGADPNFFAECNGCGNGSGSKVCSDCRSQTKKRYLTHPEDFLPV